MRKIFEDAYNEINHFSEKIGEVVYDEVFDGNPTTEIGKYVVLTFKECETERDFKIANDMLCAITGWNLDSIIERIKERDDGGYYWESIDDEEEE